MLLRVENFPYLHIYLNKNVSVFICEDLQSLLTASYVLLLHPKLHQIKHKEHLFLIVEKTSYRMLVKILSHPEKVKKTIHWTPSYETSDVFIFLKRFKYESWL